jgi:flavin reductase (DIM6/NTAB) family NADH-FMN oxidoreductase RutF
LLEDSPDHATPVLRAALAHLGCDVVRVHEEATHSIFVGQVRWIWLGEGREPLVYFDGAYCALESQAEASFDALWDRYSSAFI